MNKLFVISGKGSSGKDTFVNFIKNYCSQDLKVTNFSSIDYMKWIAKNFLNINVDLKSHKLRKFLSEFKRILTEFNDFPFKRCCDIIDGAESDEILFLHIREKSEIEKLKVKYPNLMVIYVDNNQIISYGNDSDDKCDEVVDIADVIIYNEGTLEDLNSTVKWFVKTYIYE